jgi:hypothetical protein
MGHLVRVTHSPRKAASDYSAPRTFLLYAISRFGRQPPPMIRRTSLTSHNEEGRQGRQASGGKTNQTLNAHRSITGVSKNDTHPLRGLSRIRGNSVVRFLGGHGLVTGRVYPEILPSRHAKGINERRDLALTEHLIFFRSTNPQRCSGLWDFHICMVLMGDWVPARIIHDKEECRAH